MKSFKMVLVFALLTFAFQAPKSYGDEQAETLMRQVSAKTQQTHSLSGVLTLRTQRGDEKADIRVGKVFLQRPNFLHLESSYVMGNMFGAVNSDGKQMWERSETYRTSPVDPQGKGMEYYFALQVAYFFDTKAPLTTMFAVDKTGDLHYAGKKNIDGETFDVVEQAILQPSLYTVRLLIGSDKLLRRVETEIPASSDSPREYFESDLSRVVVDKPIPTSRFIYSPPADAAIYVPPTSTLLAAGEQAPDFSLKTLSGETLTLQSALRGKKAVYLDFWFCECMACRHEFPELQKLYTALQSQGLSLYGVNALDTAPKIRQFKSRNVLVKSTTFPIILTGPGDPSGMLKKYHVDGYPSGYLIDASGKVLFTSQGFDPNNNASINALKEALVKAGFTL